ncbi:MAG: PRC-barrel domain-containing protein [Chthoniobacterales bacterium]
MLRNFQNLHGCSLAASDGEIGKVQEIYFDDQHWKVRYFVVTTGSWLTGREVLIAPSVIEGIDETHRSLAVHLSQEEVRHSPPVEADKPVSRQYEEQMYKYYGWDPYWSIADSGIGFGISPMGVGAAAYPENITPPPPITTHLRSSDELKGYRIHANDGELGKVEDFIIDDKTWHIRYLVIRPGHWPTQRHVLLAPEWIEGVSYEGAEVVVNLPSSRIEDAPEFNLPITREYEDRLHAHYERPAYWLRR